MNICTKTKIYASGIYLPSQIVSSVALMEDIRSETQYGIATDWMTETMGIIERRIADSGTKPSDLAIPAAEQALANSGIHADKIDLVIFCGIERDQPEPATAHTIQNKMGLNAPFSFDVANACFGFFDGINIASGLIKSGAINFALICTGEVSSNMMNFFRSKLKKGVDTKTARKLIGALSVGDAGSAIVLGPSESNAGFDLLTGSSDSRHIDKCIYTHQKDGSMKGQMLMGPIVNVLTKGHERLIPETLAKLEWPNFDWFLSHQMGERPFERMADAAKMPLDRMIKTYDKLGNITTATLAVNFHILSNNAKVEPGHRIGGGFSGSGYSIGQFGYTF